MDPSPIGKRPRLGDMLVEAGLVDRARIEDLIAQQGPSGSKLGRLLVSRGLVREDQVIDVLSRQLKVGRYDPGKYPADPELAALLPVELAQRHEVVPLGRGTGVLFLGTMDPTDIDALDTVEQTTRCAVTPVICTSRELNRLMNGIYGSLSALGDLVESGDAPIPELSTQSADQEQDVEIGSLVGLAEQAPVVRMVNWILAQAVREGASDIHISPGEENVTVRYRIDGKLREVASQRKSLHLSLVSRIKILSRMDIAVSRMPQDGRFTIRIENREINVRVSTIPTTHGENVVLRLLDMGAFRHTLDDLGMSARDRERLGSVIRNPHGMLLSTGPTGSGKSTTLYAMLSELNQPDVNIITVEDPVEFRVPRICQVQLNTKAGMTFASGLRSILRQDPDIIMVGEIRDPETARIAVQAALTGHMVFSTAHTNDAAGAVTRLIDMGIEPFLVSSVLLGSFAQRLVRRVCAHCGRRVPASRTALDFWGLPRDEGIEFVEAVGCARCLNTGYQGRTGVFEVMLVDDAIKAMIASRATTLDINRAAIESGSLRTLRQDAADKIRRGITTSEEAMSIVGGA